MRARDAYLKKYRRSKLDTDLAAYRLLRNKVSARIKRAKESYSRTLLEENSGDSKSFLRSVKNIMPDTKQKSIPTCIKADDKIVTDKQSLFFGWLGFLRSFRLNIYSIAPANY